MSSLVLSLCLQVNGFSQLPGLLAAGLDVRLGCVVSSINTPTGALTTVTMKCNGVTSSRELSCVEM